jgi:hypothetical protein
MKAASLHEYHLVVGQIHLLQARTLNFQTFPRYTFIRYRYYLCASDTVFYQSPIGFAHKFM